MESPQTTIEVVVKKIKEEMFISSLDWYSFVSPSAYDTAWLAMIPDPSSGPMFQACLDWVLNSQNELGFWGDCDGRGMPTIDCLPSTLACLVALKKWNVGTNILDKGLAFIHANADNLLKQSHGHFPRWFTIVFPAMVELARTFGLEIIFSDDLKSLVEHMFSNRRQILETEELVGKDHYPPLLSYMETLPSSYDIDEDDVVQHLSGDGSLFQSPSATARAYMATGNKDCMAYLESLVQNSPNGVPATYALDEELIKLCMVNQLQKLGLAEHFIQEIDEILTQVYRNYINRQSEARQIHSVGVELYKDSLAFRLLRTHGFNLSPWSFCWFLHEEEIRDLIEKNYEYFSSTMLNVYKATDVMFSGEDELEEARSFSRKLLMKASDRNCFMLPSFQTMIKHELNLSWTARLEHLDHRTWIEESENNALWMGKSFKHRFSSVHNDKIIQLAMRSYEFRQSIYKNELEELKRWCKSYGLSEIGFGREKTVYCYFAAAASTSFPYYSDLRTIIAKSAILITIIDDFFDTKGSMNELKILTNAIQRWDVKGLRSHSKTIFNALDNLLSDIAAKHGSDITKNLRDIWYETFVAWMREAKWSKSGYIPSSTDYIKTGMLSIASHTMVIPASCLLKPCLPSDKIWPSQYGTLTKLLMFTTRLLNDIQSYQKEVEDGKINLVLLHLKENPEASIEDSINYLKGIFDKKKKEFFEHVFMDDLSDMPKPYKHLHLSCFKVFHMFFNSSNRFDSETEILQDINDAIYIPLDVQLSRPIMNNVPLHSSRPKKENRKVLSHFGQTFNHHGRVGIFAKYRAPPTTSRDGYGNMFISPKSRLCFI